MASSANANNMNAVRETMDVLLEISRLLNTGLDMESLSICVRLCEQGINPEALSSVIKELRKASDSLKASDNWGSKTDPNRTILLSGSLFMLSSFTILPNSEHLLPWPIPRASGFDPWLHLKENGVCVTFGLATSVANSPWLLCSCHQLGVQSGNMNDYNALISNVSVPLPPSII